ncbi:unnamed protein product [Durusdinium trenchii]|uniref:RNA helicase n=1 Tax=Durusdinium trenchii TaxID=1381693 RepID=A0ABP0KQN3_9DINO
MLFGSRRDSRLTGCHWSNMYCRPWLVPAVSASLPRGVQNGHDSRRFQGARSDQRCRHLRWLTPFVLGGRIRCLAQRSDPEPPVQKIVAQESPSDEPSISSKEPVLTASSAESVKSRGQPWPSTPPEPSTPPVAKALESPVSSADAEDSTTNLALELEEAFVDMVAPAGDSESSEDEEDEDEDEDGLERIMGLEALQSVGREPTPPPASCSQRSEEFPNLPICEMEQEVLKQVREHRVVTIIGGTGCGKSTQVPQFIVRDAAAKQEPCNILVTQPRRLAATSLARRCAEELGLSMGVEVGYRIRGETVPGDHLSFATAGYLLSWLTAAPEGVQSMTHLILDEAHIRSADMELLLLMIRLFLRINDRLRVILMSATMEAGFFGNYFSESGKEPPKPLYVGGRLFPVNVFTLDDLAQGKKPGGKLSGPLKRKIKSAAEKAFKPDMMKSLTTRKRGTRLESLLMPKVDVRIREAVQELIPEVAEGGSTILVFIPGYADLVRMHSWLYWNLPTVGSVNMGYVPPKPEQLPEDDEEEEQEDLEEFQELQGMEGPLSDPPHVRKMDDVKEDATGSVRFRLFALHSQVAQEDQELVLQKPPPNMCNVVLATTIAESSLTLPEVIGVIDFCVHKTSVGEPSQMGLSKIVAQWCAQAACVQREGRAGRTQPGWCIRMVPEQVFDALPEYDVPEILRTPLTTLYLKAKGIADGLGQLVLKDETSAKQLSAFLETATPGQLLEQLLAPPTTKAIDAAVYQLAQLAVLTEESTQAKVTVLGRLALFLPLDIQLCRLVWLGCLLGCPAEAVVMAAACSVPSPFSNPSRLGFQDPEEFTKQLADTAAAWRSFDGGHCSEHLTFLRLFQAWLRRLSATPVRSASQQRWFRATHMLEKDAAIDASRMTAFVAFVADLAVRCRDLCSNERDTATSCQVRADLHGLVCLLRRPDKNREQQQALISDDYVPDIGDVFRAPARKLYALLATAFSDTLLVGSHIAKDGDMLDALDMLDPSGVASQDAVLIPQHGIKRSDSQVSTLLETITGQAPSDIAQSSRFIAVKFRTEDVDDTKISLVSRRHDPRTMGLGPAEEPRLMGVNMLPRLCHMSAGGPRRFSIGEAPFARATSPYELEFSVVHEARGNRRTMLGVVGEQTPLGFACHVVADGRLGSEHFACVASQMTLSEFGARVSNATLLTAEEMVFALITKCSTLIPFQLGFGQGPGGTATGSHAGLMGLRFQREDEVHFQRFLPGEATLSKVNAIRTAIMENLVSPAEANSDGQEILLWEDFDAQKDFEELIRIVHDSETVEEMGGLYGAESHPIFWIGHRPNLRKQGSDEDAEEENEEEDLEDAEIQALQPIAIRMAGMEDSVALRTARLSPQIEHSLECPDCGECFDDWPSCREHLALTGHLDVSNKQAESRARQQCQPVRWRCLECFEGFPSLEKLDNHLKQSGHLSWADPKTQRNLCKPRRMPDFDDDSEVSEAAPAESAMPSGGFFRSLGSSLWTNSAKKTSQISHPDAKTEAMIEESTLTASAKDLLRRCAAYDARHVVTQLRSIGHDVKDPDKFVKGILKNLSDQGLITSIEKDALLLRLDAFDLDASSMQRLQRMPNEAVEEVVQRMQNADTRMDLSAASMHLLSLIKEVEANGQPMAKTKAKAAKQPAASSQDKVAKKKVLDEPTIPPVPNLQVVEDLGEKEPPSQISHPDAKTEAMIEESTLTASAKDLLRRCAAYDARHVVTQLRSIGHDVKDPDKFVKGSLKNLSDQGLITSIEKDALLLRLDAFDLDGSSMQRLQRMPNEAVEEVVQRMQNADTRMDLSAASMHLLSLIDEVKAKGQPIAKKKVLEAPTIPPLPDLEEDKVVGKPKAKAKAAKRSSAASQSKVAKRKLPFPPVPDVGTMEEERPPMPPLPLLPELDRG